MAEDNTKAQEPVKETQEPAMPAGQEEQKTPESAKAVEKQDVLPESASDRTKAEFEKLTTDLREERQRRERIEDAFKTLQPAQGKVEEPIFDPVTGLIDGQKLTEVQRKANEAEQQTMQLKNQIQGLLEQQEASRAYVKYAWTNPANKEFDQKKSDLAAAIALASMVRPDKYGGKQLDLAGAAEFVDSLSLQAVESAKKEATKEAIEQLSPKEQAALEATGTAGRREETETPLDYDAVREVTRKGGSDGLVATMARLRALKTQAST